MLIDSAFGIGALLDYRPKENSGLTGSDLRADRPRQSPLCLFKEHLMSEQSAARGVHERPEKPSGDWLRQQLYSAI